MGVRVGVIFSGTTVSYSFCLVRCLLKLAIFKKKKKTLIIPLRLEFDDDVTCSETLVTRLKRDRTHLLHEVSCQVLYSV